MYRILKAAAYLTNEQAAYWFASGFLGWAGNFMLHPSNSLLYESMTFLFFVVFALSYYFYVNFLVVLQVISWK